MPFEIFLVFAWGLSVIHTGPTHWPAPIAPRTRPFFRQSKAASIAASRGSTNRSDWHMRLLPPYKLSEETPPKNRIHFPKGDSYPRLVLCFMFGGVILKTHLGSGCLRKDPARALAGPRSALLAIATPWGVPVCAKPPPIYRVTCGFPLGKEPCWLILK